MEKLPKLAELFGELPVKENELQVLLNQNPKPEWVLVHPILKIKYMSIERVEYLLSAIFVLWHVEIKSCQLIGNSVVVIVRLYYRNPIDGTMLWQDGIGASPLQTDKGSGAIDFNNLKSGAVMMAAPAAESFAIKDAAEKIGKLFGKDLNRKEEISYNSLAGRFNLENPETR